MTGCPVIGDPNGDPQLFVVEFENHTPHEQVTITGTSSDGERLTRALRHRPPGGEGYEAAVGCLDDLGAASPNGEMYRIGGRLCPGDVWRIGEGVTLRPSREEVVTRCDDADASRDLPRDLWEFIAAHGFRDRDDFRAAVDASDDHESLAAIRPVVDQGQHEICRVARDERTWDYETNSD